MESQQYWNLIYNFEFRICYEYLWQYTQLLYKAAKAQVPETKYKRKLKQLN